jgi:hypothetical protein
MAVQLPQVVHSSGLKQGKEFRDFLMDLRIHPVSL